MFTLHGISKSFGATEVLRDISFDVPEGRTTVLLGPSGCGKSTLLRLMLGLIPPDRGAIHFAGNVVDPGCCLEMRRQMGYVIQNGGLFPHMSARANITLMARHLRKDKSWQNARAEELAGLTEFPVDALDKYPAQLSGGQKQRVALMRALMLDPPVLLMDEPMGALDSIVRYQLQTDLRDIFDDLGKTVVIVTHDVAEAAYFSDHLILLKDGRIAQEGNVGNLLDNPAEDFVTDFITAQRGLRDVLQETRGQETG